MSNNSSQAAGGGIGFFGLLCILFIGLKLTGHITWSWLWVLSPLWIPIGLFFAILGFIAAIFVIIRIAESARTGKGRR